jgi:transcriptional regulator with XRE-family HTH domain
MVFDERRKAIGRNLKRFREQKSWTQESLAEKADIHVSYIGQIERGLRYPSLKVLFKIADALSIKIHKFFG